MVRSLRWITVLLVIALGLAGCGGAAQPTATPAATPTSVAAAPTEVPATPEPTAAPAAELGAEQRSEEGGFSFKPVADFTVTGDGGVYMLMPANADPEQGPIFMIAGGPMTGVTDPAELLKAVIDESSQDPNADVSFTAAQPSKIGGIDGLSADLSGSMSGKDMAGRVVVGINPDTEQGITIYGLAPAAMWAELSPTFDAVQGSITLFEPVKAAGSSASGVSAPTTPLDAEPGVHIYANANFVQDIAFFDGKVWAATLAGVVAWDPASGTSVRYTTLQGLPSLGTYAIEACPAPDPTVIVGTEQGIVAYNPASDSWQPAYTFPADSYLDTVKVDDMHCDSANSRLLTGLSGVGIFNYADGSWKSISDDEGLPTSTVSDVAVAGDTIWATTSYKGISAIQGDQVTVYTEENGLPDDSTYGVDVTPDGTVWVGAGEGLLKFQNGTWELLEDVGGFSSVQNVIANADGSLWISNTSKGICRFDPASGTCAESYPYEVKNYGYDYVTSLAVSDDGSMVAFGGNGTGITLVSGGTAQQLATDDKLATNFVESINELPDGTLVIGTDYGAQFIAPDGLDGNWQTETYNEAGLASSWVSGAFRAPDGSMWLTGSSPTISVYSADGWAKYTKDDNGLIAEPEDIVFAADGTAWLGTREGLVAFDGSSVTEVISEPAGLPTKNVRTLLLDGDGLLVGTTKGLARVQDGSVEVLLKDIDVRDIAQQDDGSLLLATDDGVVQFTNGKTKSLLDIPYQGGLFGYGGANHIARDSKGTWWVGSGQGVFYSADGTDWQQLTTADGLGSNYVNALYVDRYDTIWIGGGYTNGGGGLIRYIP